MDHRRGVAVVGGRFGLALRVAEHRGAIRADLRRFFGVRLDQVGTRWFGWQDLADYLVWPPMDGAYVRALHGGSAPWGPTEFLLRNLIYAQTGGKWNIRSPQEQVEDRRVESELDAQLIEMERRERERRGGD